MEFKSTFFLIGGGVMRRDETVKIDKFLVELTRDKAKNEIPSVLFIPTGSEDLPAYIEDFTNRYESYGCRVIPLKLMGKVDSTEAQTKIDHADMIYIGGGNPKLILNKFKEYKIDRKLTEICSKKNILVGGLSAGAAILCSQYFNFDFDENRRYQNIKLSNGLGLIKKVFWAHFDLQQNDRDEFYDLYKKIRNPIIALENKVMAIFVKETYQLYSETNETRGHEFKFSDKELIDISNSSIKVL